MANNVISPQQHGFTRGRSYSTQLLLAMNDWTKALHSVDILYFDLVKAFDSVPCNRFIYKLQGCGISEKLLAWVRNVLNLFGFNIRVESFRIGLEFVQKNLFIIMIYLSRSDLSFNFIPFNLVISIISTLCIFVKSSMFGIYYCR